jgi:WD40 repeat protein
VTGSADTTLRLWDAESGASLAIMEGHGAQVWRIAVSPKGDLIASGDQRGEIRLWDQQSGAFVRKLDLLANRIGALSFDPTGRYLVAGPVASSDVVEGMKVWDVENSRLVAAYPALESTAVVLPHPREPLVAAGGVDGSIHIWNYLTGQRVKVLRGRGDTIWSVALAPDGSQIGWGKTWQMENVRGRALIDHWLDLPAGPAFWPRHLGMVRQAALPTVPPGLPMSSEDDNHAPVFLSTRRGGPMSLQHAIMEVKRNDTVTAVEQSSAHGYRHQSLGFLPGTSTIISGGENGHLSALDLHGQRIGTFFGHDSTMVVSLCVV